MTEEGVRLTNLKGRPVLAVDTGREVARVVEGLFQPRSLRLEGLLCEISPAPESPGDEAARAGLYRLLGLDDLLAIGPHAVTVASVNSLNLPHARPALAALVNWERVMAGQRQSQSQRCSAALRPLLDWLTFRPRTRPPRGSSARAYSLPCPIPVSGITGPSQPPVEFDNLPVLTDRGEQIGELQDLLIDPQSGRLGGLFVREAGFFRRLRSPIFIPATEIRSIGSDACIVRSTAAKAGKEF